ncbi:MAG: threonine--tRNA ligase [Ignavibacteriales bacterium]|nr:threonine--tRNA ligase [Ignavibacteriales bacterium]MBI3786693.1 threonine--tRNA ligase [Ignavibacteriales bacterium]
MEKIKITFPDGTVKEFDKGTTGRQIAESISKGLAKEALAVEVNGEVWDLSRGISNDASLKILKWADDGGKYAFWHSSAHLMAEAIENIYPGTKFGIGPPIENGFYYDIDMGDHTLTGDDLSKIEEKMYEFASRDVAYQREEKPWEEAVSYFKKKGDPYKLELLEDLKGQTISFYHQGNFTDLCYGPHIPSTGRIKAIKLLSVAGAYWRGSEKNKMLQRIYGVTFPTKQELDQHLFRLEEAKRRDHRKLGQELELFLLTPKVGGGLPLWLPKGTVVREILENFLREEQKKRGYLAVMTPHIGNINLYKTSGHYPYYKDSQFTPVKVEEEEYLLKPMNCPHHFQIYAAKPRSYRDLPIRLAEFGTVYRYEQSGELNGLIRVRSFTVDDSHMFMRQDQLKQELCDVIELIQLVFNTLGFSDFKTRLSFRDPKNKDKYGGEDAMWVQAEKDIKEAADLTKLNYYIGIGEAAFYGPKIDFMVRDALGRTWQLGTVQVDYVMPERFNLEYVGADGQKHRPVVIHRAPFGSMERFMGVLIEHFAGEFPLWLAPLQAVVLPITDQHLEYAQTVYQQLKAAGIRCELDDRNEKVGYKIRDWETKKVPYMLVVGEKEQSANTVSVRQHKKGDLGSMSRDAFLSLTLEAVKQKKITL